MKRNIFFILIFSIIIILFIFFYFGLKSNPKYSTKHLIGEPVSNFSAETLLDSNVLFTNKDFTKNNYSIINIWSSWCQPCREEHPFLMSLSQRKNLKIYGINFKDNNKNAKIFLEKYGNPFTKIGVDHKGTLSINLGAFGVPETILINSEGIILSKIVGPMKKKDYQAIILKINE